MLNWVGIDQPMKMKETSRDLDKKPNDNNNLDVAMYDTFIRAAKPWAYRYPIEDAQGAVGSPSSPDDHSAARYVEMRSAALANYFFGGLKKNAVKEWYDNYDDTEKIPSVFPSIGFWNVVNGSSGIAVAMVTSVPQFNIKEVNEALIKIIKNPEIDFDDIYCVPDFATGGYIINPEETKEGMRKGEGVSIKLRAKLEYDAKDNLIKASNLPYGVYTNVIMKQLANIVNTDEAYGIKKVIDHTKKDADIRIYLQKDTDAEKIKRKLYADTSLEDSYLINMIMLDEGRFPKVFGWREACDAYIKHIRECKFNEIEYDYNKAIARKNILTGLIIAAANIDDIVKIIRSSTDQKEASANLIAKYSFNKEQVEAILAMKLSSLTKIDGVKIKDEDAENDKFIASCRYLLDTPSALDEELIKILKEVAAKFGDNRRTEIIIVDDTIEENIEEDVYVTFYDNSTVKVSVSKDEKEANVIKTVEGTTNSNIMFITQSGKLYSASVSTFKVNSQESIYKYLKIDVDDKVIWRGISNECADNFFAFVANDGSVKKSPSEEYATIKSKNGTIACKLKEGNKLLLIELVKNNDTLLMFTNTGNYIRFKFEIVSEVGRIAGCSKGIKLNGTDEIINVQISKNNNAIIAITSDGKAKLTNFTEFVETNKAVKGNAVIKLSAGAKVIFAKQLDDFEDKIDINSKIVEIKSVPVRMRNASGKKIL